MMKKVILFLGIYFLFFIFLSFNTNQKNTINFKLKNVDGKLYSLTDYPKARGFIIIFTCNHCPFAKLYTKRLNEICKKYQNLNVQLIAINSMDTLAYEDEGFKNMQKKAKAESFNFPYLYDPLQIVAKNFKANRTPEAFVIWKQNNVWEIKYRGAIDDNGAEPEKVMNEYLKNAVNELLNNNIVYVQETASMGCSIYYRK